jgi:hypothetical protein
MNLEVRILNKLRAYFSEVRILKSLAFLFTGWVVFSELRRGTARRLGE